jgi:YVTN family beta-propeller protein
MASIPSLGRLFVASKNTKSLVVLDETTQTVLKNIPVDNRPWGVGVANNRVFVANSGGANVSVIDPVAMTEIKRIKLNGICDGMPANIAVDPTTNRVYVAIYGMGRVAVIDAVANNLIDCIPTNASTFGVAVNPALHQLYVTNRDAFDLQVFDISVIPAHRIQDLALGGVPFFVQANTTTNMVYAMVAYDKPTYSIASSLQVYTATSAGVTQAFTRTIGNTDDGGTLLVSQTNGKLYVAATHDNLLQVIDPTTYTVCTTVPMIDPFGMTQNPTLHRVYVGNREIAAIGIVSDSLCP